MSQETMSEQSLMKLLVNSSIDAMISFDMEWRITAWNNAAEQTYDTTAEAAIGRPITDVVPGLGNDPEAAHALHVAKKGMKSFLPADKNIKFRSHCETHFIPLLCESGKQTGIMQLVHDVSHRIKAERELQRLNDSLQLNNMQLSRTMEEMATYSTITGNQIKVPVRNLYTDVEYLIKLEAKNLSDSGKATFRRMQQALNKMNLILDDIQQLSEIGVAHSSDLVNLDDIVTEVKFKMQNKIEETNAHIEVSKLCKVSGDKTLMEKLFYHLLDNAIKFNEGQPPDVNISCEEVIYKPEETISAAEYFKVDVKDNGIGIDKSEHEKIFTLFEKATLPRKYRGTGLGLTLARKIMNAHNGYIEVSSEIGAGSTFTLYFPKPEESNK